MAIRGWVYVVTNKSMDGLVKIGYSTKDPKLRAGEFGTGAPHKYEVVYDVLVEDPQSIEQRVHKSLKHRREGKEWFRCGISEAVSAIRTVVGKGAITEKLSNQADDIYVRPEDVLPPINRQLQGYGRSYAISKLKEEMDQIRKRKEGE